MRLVVALLVVLVATARPVRAEDLARPYRGCRVQGDSKLTDRTCRWLSHLDLGDPVTASMVPEIEAALMSSELFETATVTLEDTPDGGVLVVATLKDKMSWIAAPTLFILPSHWAVGAGYAESNLGGENKKMLLYGQLGNRTSLFLGTFLDPSFHGSNWQMRFDVYLLHEIVDEYANPVNDPRSTAIDRESTFTFLDGGALLGYTVRWWLVADARLRGAYAYYRDAHAVDTMQTPLPVPEKDGWDWSLQARITLDARSHYYGVTWGPYAQLIVEPSVPLLDSYNYQLLKARVYYSWKFFQEHELELRTRLLTGHNLPFHEEQTLGGVSDLRGYSVDQFRGNFSWMARAEYSVPIAKWRFFAFRALGFYDTGVEGDWNHPTRTSRNFLPDQTQGRTWYRNDVGAGFRVYVKSIVLPLLGFDVGWGLEAHDYRIYFEVGLTDF